MKDTKLQKIIGTAAIIILLIVGIYVMEHRGVYQVKLVTPTEPRPTATYIPTPTKAYKLDVDKVKRVATAKFFTESLTFTYPETWLISEYPDTIVIYTLYGKTIGAGELESGGSLTISWFNKDSFVKTASDSTARQILEKNYIFIRDNATDSSVSIAHQNDLINGNPVIRYKTKPWGIGNADEILIYINNRIFKLSCIYADKDKAEVSDGCEKIVSSFNPSI